MNFERLPVNQEIKEETEQLSEQERRIANRAGEFISKEADLIPEEALEDSLKEEVKPSDRNSKIKKAISAFVLSTALSGFLASAPEVKAEGRARRVTGEIVRIYGNYENMTQREKVGELRRLERELRGIERAISRVSDPATADKLSAEKDQVKKKIKEIENSVNNQVKRRAVISTVGSIFGAVSGKRMPRF